MTNAAKYNSGSVQPEIVISTELAADHFILSFKDNGIGIDLEKNGAKLFKPFTRFNTSEEEGSGVGLFIVRKVINRLNGKIEVLSELGMGSEFKLKLPKKIAVKN